MKLSSSKIEYREITPFGESDKYLEVIHNFPQLGMDFEKEVREYLDKADYVDVHIFCLVMMSKSSDIICIPKYFHEKIKEREKIMYN